MLDGLQNLATPRKFRHVHAVEPLKKKIPRLSTSFLQRVHRVKLVMKTARFVLLPLYGNRMGGEIIQATTEVIQQ